MEAPRPRPDQSFAEQVLRVPEEHRRFVVTRPCGEQLALLLEARPEIGERQPRGLLAPDAAESVDRARVERPRLVRVLAREGHLARQHRGDRHDVVVSDLHRQRPRPRCALGRLVEAVLVEVEVAEVRERPRLVCAVAERSVDPERPRPERGRPFDVAREERRPSELGEGLSRAFLVSRCITERDRLPVVLGRLVEEAAGPFERSARSRDPGTRPHVRRRERLRVRQILARGRDVATPEACFCPAEVRTEPKLWRRRRSPFGRERALGHLEIDVARTAGAQDGQGGESDRHGGLALPRVGRPAERRNEPLELGGERASGAVIALRALRERETALREMRGVGGPGRLPVDGVEPPLGVFTNGRIEAEAQRLPLVRGRARDEERLVAQRFHAAPPGGAHHRLGPLHGEAVGKHAQP